MLCVCVCSDGFLCLFRCVCVCVCVVMGLNRLISVSWVCVWLCALNWCQRLREKEKKKIVGKPRKTKVSVRKK